LFHWFNGEILGFSRAKDDDDDCALAKKSQKLAFVLYYFALLPPGEDVAVQKSSEVMF
jgi:hypothetical protein